MKNTKTRTQQFTLALLLLTVSLLSLQPALTLADDGSQKGTITINATGQATPMNPKVTGGPATLSLSGNARQQDGNSVKFSGLSGNLQVGANNYPISNGQGQANPHGTIEIHATTNGNGNKKNELNLYGHMQGSSITFDSNQSKLSSMFFLSLSGQANMNIPQTISKSISNTISRSINNTISKTINNTISKTINNTISKTSQSSEENQTESESQGAATVTQTKTITVTNTVGNVTTTKTVTSTVTNSTVTVTATITIANTTVTVT